MERDDESVNKSTRPHKVRAPERGVLIRTRLESVVGMKYGRPFLKVMRPAGRMI